MRASEMCIEKIQFFPRLALKCGKGNQRGAIQMCIMNCVIFHPACPFILHRNQKSLQSCLNSRREKFKGGFKYTSFESLLFVCCSNGSTFSIFRKSVILSLISNKSSIHLQTETTCHCNKTLQSK